MLRTILTTLLIFNLCSEYRVEISQSATSGTLENILWWLPENTETLMVTKGPFTIIDSDRIDPNTHESINLKNMLEPWSYGPLTVIREGKFLKPILGKTILLSVEGSRKFGPPASLGSAKYEGCQVLVFGQDFATARDSFIELLKTNANKVEKIAEYPVLVFEEKLESDLWKIFVVSPKPDLVLCATDQDFLTEMLNRMGSKAINRALPESLPEWKQVDTSAQFWAIRHYDKENALRDHTSPLYGKQAAANAPDMQAIGLTFTYNPKGNNEARIKYLSANKEAAKIADKYWNPDSYELNAKVSTREAGIVEIIVNPDNPDVISIFLLVLLAAFGHAIYV
jgi:hypothetical protein